MARRQGVLYRDEIVPRSRQALEAARANWLAGPGLFLEVIDARRQLLDAELTFARATAEQHQQLSDVVLAGGFPDLEALLEFVATVQVVPGPNLNPSSP